MTPKPQHEEFESLLGAYVLNAVDPLEHRRIERHIASCPDCAREVALLRGPASELASLEGADPDTDELVDRITSALPWRPRKLVTRATAVVAAVAFAVAGFLGTSLLRERSEQEQLVDILAAAERTVNLQPKAGFNGKGKLFVADGRVALVLEQVPDPGRGKSYQLWAVRGSKPTSMAVLGGGERVVDVLEWDGSADVFAITIEPAGGSPVPTTDPVLSGT
jgi:anti-sigma-K factor RskA